MSILFKNIILLKLIFISFIWSFPLSKAQAIKVEDLQEYTFSTAAQINSYLIDNADYLIPNSDNPSSQESFESYLCESVINPELPGFCWMEGMLPHVDWRATFLASTDMQQAFLSSVSPSLSSIKNRLPNKSELSKAIFAQKYILQHGGFHRENDLGLVIKFYYDADDELISKKLVHVKVPLIYRVSSEKYGVAHILGSQHNLPLRVFSPATQKFLKSQDVLVLEDAEATQTSKWPENVIEYAPGEYSELRQFTQTQVSGFIEEVRKINELSYKNGDFDRKFDIDKITPFGIFLLSYYHITRGMDSELEHHYRERESVPLSLEESSNSMLMEFSPLFESQHTKGDAQDLIDESKRFLKAHTNNMVDDCGQSLKDYCFGLTVEDEDEEDSAALKIRNKNWIEKILGIMKKHTDESILFTVGADHLPGVFEYLRGLEFQLDRYRPDLDDYVPSEI
jgi:hypothetical protein